MQASVLERVLLSQVERELEELGRPLGNPEAALAELRAVLEREELRPDERRLLAQGPQALLSARIEEALRAAVRAMSGGAGARSSPRIVVLPGRGDTEEVRATLVASLRRPAEADGTLALDPADPSAEDSAPRATLVLADEAQMSGLRGDTGKDGLGTLRLPSLTEHPELDGRDIELVGARGLGRDLERLEATLVVARGAAPERGARTRTASPRDLVGTVLGGQYEIRRVIGEGGFGAVLEAFDRELLTSVAIKIVRPEAVRSRRDLDDFKEEARRVTRLKHPNIVEWKTLSETPDGTPYFVMEYLDGEELEEVLKREGKLPWPRVQEILLQVLGALRAAHHLEGGGSILHLDLKPKNIFITRNAQGEDVAKVIDFGIGQLALGRPQGGGEEGGSLSAETLLEEAGVDPRRIAAHSSTRASGCTPEYASPEQSAHMMPGDEIEPLDGRSDLYSLGVVAYQMLTGSLPFDPPRSGKRREYLRLHREVEPRRLSAAGVKVPRALARFVEQCLVKDRERRWHDTHEAHAALQRIVHPAVTRPVVALLGSLGIALAMVVWLLLREPPTGLLAANWIDARGEQQELGRTVYLGPSRPEARLRVNEGVDLRAAEVLRLVENKAAGEAHPAWQVEPLDGDELLVRRVPGAEETRSRLYLQVSDGSTLLSTEQLSLEYVGPDAYRILARVEGVREDEPVDPLGRQLEVSVYEGPAEAIESVRLRVPGCDERVGNRLRQPQEREAIYAVDLGFLAGRHDEQGRMEVLLVDRTGGEHSVELEQPFDGRPFRPLVELEGAQPLGGSWLVGREALALRITSDRPADVVWSLERGEPLGPLEERKPLQGDPDRPTSIPLYLHGEDDRSWSGRLQVVVTDRVQHLDRERGRGGASFVLDHNAQDLELTSVVLGDRELAAGGSEPIFLAARETQLVLVRNGAPMWARLRIAREGVQLADSGRQDHLAPGALTLPVAFPGDGPHAVELEYGGLDPGSMEPRGERRRWQRDVVVDTHAPTWVQVPERLFDTRRDAWEPRLAVEDGQEPTAVRISRSLRHLESGQTLGSPVESSHPVGEILLGEPPPWTQDGEWELTLWGRDAAGNPLERRTVPVTVGRRGPPELRVTHPRTSSDLPWMPWSEGEGHVLEASVDDPNGVDSVTVEFSITRAGELLEGPQRLALTRRDPTGTRWFVPMAFDERQSEAQVELRLLAVDGFGNEASSQPHVLRLSTIEARRPGTLLVRRPGSPLATRMSLVRVEPGERFVLAGRPADLDRLVEAGLGRPLLFDVAMALPEGGDYYLDETEVRVADFLLFLQDPRGYLDPELWAPGAHGPRPEERDELLARLLELDGDLPATGITWDEALAFARWRGVRLQSCFEWEYAVRGGPAYRLSSIADPREASVCLRRDAPLAGPWPVDRGEDLVPGTVPGSGGLRNLCSNVSEWTSTPYRLGGLSDPLGPADFPLRDPLLGPGQWQRLEKLRLVGGSYREANWSFAERDWGRRVRPGDPAATLREPDVGLRCAISLAELREARERGLLEYEELR